MTFPTKEEVNINLLSGLKLLTCQPYSKESSCNSKSILKGYTSTKTGYRCQMSTPFDITRFTQSWMESWGMYLLRQTTQSFLFIISLWIVFIENGFASSTRTLRFFQSTIHPSDTTTMTSLYQFVLCILINRFLRSLSSSVMSATMSTRMVSTHEGST